MLIQSNYASQTRHKNSAFTCFFFPVFRFSWSRNWRALGNFGAMLAEQSQSYPPLPSHHLRLGAERTFVLHKTCCSLLGPLKLRQILRRAHDWAADGGNFKLFNRAYRNATILPTDIDEKNVKSLRWCSKQRLKSSGACCGKRNDSHKAPCKEWWRQKRVSTNCFIGFKLQRKSTKIQDWMNKQKNNYRKEHFAWVEIFLLIKWAGNFKT